MRQRATRQKLNISKSKQKTALEIFIDYLVLANPNGLQKKIYELGGFAFFGQGAYKAYLKRNALAIAEKEGANNLFEIHPDRAVILALFAPKSTSKAQTETESILSTKKEKQCTCSTKKKLKKEAKQKGIKEQYFYFERRKSDKYDALSLTKATFFALILLGIFFLLRNKF